MSSTAEPVQASKSSSRPQENNSEQYSIEPSKDHRDITGREEGRRDDLGVKSAVDDRSLPKLADAEVSQHEDSKVQSFENIKEAQQHSIGDPESGEGGLHSGGTAKDGKARNDYGHSLDDVGSGLAQVSGQLQGITVNERNHGTFTSSTCDAGNAQEVEDGNGDDQIRDSDKPRPQPIRVGTELGDGNESKANEEQGAADADQNAKSEIQSIMDQFEDGKGGPGESEIMSPRLEIAQPQSFPPRSSSLEPSKRNPASPDASLATGFIPLAKQSTSQSLSGRSSGTFSDHQGRNSDMRAMSPDVNSSPRSSISTFKPPPPEPDPEPDLPFDFHRFLEQLRHRTADPVAKFLRSFLLEFGKKQWMVHEQVKIISDFLEFISKKMAQCEVWRTVSDAEFDNAREGMEKLVMNRLYTQSFSPAIPPPEPTPGKGRRKNPQAQNEPGRKGQHQEDVERDEVLAQKVRIYGWVREEHLDIKPVGDKGRKFLRLAQQGTRNNLNRSTKTNRIQNFSRLQVIVPLETK